MANTQRRQLRVVDQRHVGRRVQQRTTASEETRRERTVRIGPARLAEVLKRIRLCRQLSNPLVYEWKAGEPGRFVQSIRDEVDALEYELEHPGKSAGPAGIFEETAAR